MMRYSNISKERVEFLIFSSPVGLHGDDFAIKEPFNKALKFMKFLKHLRFKPEQIDHVNLLKSSIKLT
jgi:hypothetical protein